MSDSFERAALREDLDAQASRARAVRDSFLIHLAVYVAVNVLLVAIWALSDREEPWFLYPLLGWGVGLAAHGAVVKVHTMRHRERAARLVGEP
jgi:hypothetical protein